TIILSGSPHASFVELARQNGQPLVMIGRSEPDCDHVRIDNAGAAARAAALFVSWSLTRLGLAGSATATPSVVERERAFIGEAKRLGATVEGARGRGSEYSGGQAAADTLLASPKRPQAVFWVNDLIALGLLDAARAKFGLVVPNDLAVIGFDDIPEASWDAYRLTTFRQDPDEMAACAIEQLERRLANPAAKPSTIQLEPPFIPRNSTPEE